MVLFLLQNGITIVFKSLHLRNISVTSYIAIILVMHAVIRNATIGLLYYVVKGVENLYFCVRISEQIVVKAFLVIY